MMIASPALFGDNGVFNHPAGWMGTCTYVQVLLSSVGCDGLGVLPWG